MAGGAVGKEDVLRLTCVVVPGHCGLALSGELTPGCGDEEHEDEQAAPEGD